MTSATRSRLIRIRRRLLTWHTKQNDRDLSWRSNVRNPYEVWICEMMGQQTQASRIEGFLQRFLDSFPTVERLASAKQSEVIKAWQGLGYNRRALQLHQAAKQLVERFEGDLPRTEAELRSLPGIGPYTASAILVFAFNQAVSAVDVNVSRVITRVSRRTRTRSDTLPISAVQEINLSILPSQRNREWHEALMDLGATICTKNRPRCTECPLQKVCPSSNLYKDAASAPKRANNERSYHGAPKRIWRGRLLTLVAASATSASVLRRKLAKYQNLKEDQATEILDLVLPALLSDNFIRLLDGKYELS